MQLTRPRHYWIDVTKVIGIFLVYYAHVLQATYHFSTDVVFFQYKLIYAFHVPLFFFISGFFYRRSGHPLLTEIGVQFQKRIFPVFLFGALSLALWPLYTYLIAGETDIGFVLANALGYLQGRPGLNPAIWFLVCLFMVGVWAALLLPRINSVLQGVLLSCAMLYFGYSLTITPEFEDFFLIPRNLWYFHESVVAFGFFSMGYSTFPWIRKLTGLAPVLRLALVVFLGSITVWTVNLNSPEQGFVVLMKISKHGNYYFFISAFAGSLAMILIASLVPRLKWIDYIGRNTLILMGTNGLFIEFFNHHLIRWLDHYDSTAWVTFDSLWISVLTIGLSVPVIELLDRWVPQLVGRPQVDGPLLRGFPLPQFRFLTKFFEGISRLLGNIRED
jgi:fucose 4-O-acetylase-like acetyltransferase